MIHRDSPVPVWTLCILLLAALLLSGCVGAAVGVGTTTGIAVAQERSIGNAVDDNFESSSGSTRASCDTASGYGPRPISTWSRDAC